MDGMRRIKKNILKSKSIEVSSVNYVLEVIPPSSEFWIGESKDMDEAYTHNCLYRPKQALEPIKVTEWTEW